MEKIYHIVISDPPTKYTIKKKRAKLDKKGQPYLPESVHYLTANLFYDGTHWMIKSEIINYVKSWILPFLYQMPKIEKCRIKFIYHHNTDTFDLDNKAYFWVKVLLDIMKTPSTKQVMRSKNYSNGIKTVNALKDDTVRYVDGINMKYKKGTPALEIIIYGRKLDEQVELFGK